MSGSDFTPEDPKEVAARKAQEKARAAQERERAAANRRKAQAEQDKMGTGNQG